MSQRSLCIVDTSSLINSREVELGKMSLDKWLWKEFEVKYSRTVLEEFRKGRTKGDSKRKWEDHIWPLPTISTYERILFTSLKREIEEPCRRCGKLVSRNESFTIDFDDDRDKGERHNCCVALDVVKAGKYPQVIFLIDDFHAVRDYIRFFLMRSLWEILGLCLIL